MRPRPRSRWGEVRAVGGGKVCRSSSFRSTTRGALHWDFRLEHEGVLVSWALPKGLPQDPASNHLAVHTEDHPLDYGTFEGEIPAGEYGGGQVRIWDHGHFEVEKWRPDEVMVVLHGSKVDGRYVLFPTGGKNWMIHRMDPAPEGFHPLPQHVRPMLATAGALPEDDDGWAFEIKWDGVRAISFIEGGRLRLVSRNDKDLTSAFPELGSWERPWGHGRACWTERSSFSDQMGSPTSAVCSTASMWRMPLRSRSNAPHRQRVT